MYVVKLKFTNAYVFITGVPERVPNVMFDELIIDGSIVTLTLSWGEPFNNLNPIVNYTVSCSGDVTCPPNFNTTDNTTRSYTITDLTTMTNYIFSVVATNSIGSGISATLIFTTPAAGMYDYYILCTYVYVLSTKLLRHDQNIHILNRRFSQT